MNIHVSADSTCDLTDALVREYGIGITPLYILMGTETHTDGIDCTAQDIFDYYEKTKKLCSTAAVSIADYQEYFSRQLESADQLVHFTISSDMSVCYQNAVTAAEEFAGRVFVVDSRNLSTGIGQLALDAVLLAREGKDGAEIKAVLDERKARLNVSFVIDTLEYLHKGGRCSGVAALGANLLKLRPCIEVIDGAMVVGKKYRGTMDKCLEAYVRERIGDGDTVDKRRIFVTDSGASDAAVETVTAFLREKGFQEILHTRAGSTISSHCGPGTLGVLYYNL